jgi:CheY-like chemotaxis protein
MKMWVDRETCDKEMSKRILIIDDEENIRRVMRLTLEAAGYEANEACDGAQGLQLYGDGAEWDAVLLDQRMPGMDGLETLRHIKERNAGARVVMATAFASIELAVDAMKFGASDFVRKPMTPEVLRQALSAALAKPETSSAFNAKQPTPEDDKSSGRPRSLIQIQTFNGFEISRSTEKRLIPLEPNEHAFMVVCSDGKECEVIVEIDDEAVGYVERLTRRKLAVNGSYWATRAERLLTCYLWNEGKVPFNGKLILRDINRDELQSAARWQDD